MTDAVMATLPGTSRSKAAIAGLILHSQTLHNPQDAQVQLPHLNLGRLMPGSARDGLGHQARRSLNLAALPSPTFPGSSEDWRGCRCRSRSRILVGVRNNCGIGGHPSLVGPSEGCCWARGTTWRPKCWAKGSKSRSACSSAQPDAMHQVAMRVSTVLRGAHELVVDVDIGPHDV